MPGTPATSPRLGIPRYANTDAADFATDVNAVVDAVDASVALVTSLPGSPRDGQEIFYVADATTGVVWHLRYRVASPNSSKWEFVGGPSTAAVQGTGGAQTTANITTYTAMTGTPSLTAPLAGYYDILCSGDLYDITTADWEARVFLAVNGTLAFPVGWAAGKATSGNVGGWMGSTTTRATLAAGSVLTLLIATNGTAVATAALIPWTIRLVPVRVG